MKKAAFFEIKEKKKVQCLLCPHYCLLDKNEVGKCLVRKNQNGNLFSENYELLCSVSIDPIEKKPLYHFYPGKNILSIGSVGCNLKCKFCQNYHISQSGVSEFDLLESYTSHEIVNIALRQEDNIGIAYTYNEPIIWYEYVHETANQAQDAGLKNVFVSNGFINPDPLKKLLDVMDAFSIDLKGFTEEFYRDFTSAKLKPVLNTIKTIADSDKHLEITNLVITGINDNEKVFSDMIDWIARECGKNTVLHISRYFPMFKIKNLPTPESKLERLYEIAKEKLHYVYLGNIRTDFGQTTYCPDCNEVLLRRNRYKTENTGLNEKNNCQNCDLSILNYEH